MEAARIYNVKMEDANETDGIHDDDLWPEEKLMFYFGLALVMTIVGVAGNTLVLAAPFCEKKLRTPSNVFILNLAIADMVVSGMSNPFVIVAIFHGERWFLKHWIFCEIIGDMCMTACTASLANIFMIALNRYIAVCQHQYYQQWFTWRKTIIMACSVWLFCFMIVVPINHSGWVGNVFDVNYLICILDQHKDYVYNYIWVFCLVAMPVATIAFFYLRIFLTIRKQKRIVKTGSVGDAGAAVGSSASKEDVKLAKTLFVTYAVFVVCWLPYAASLLTDVDLWWNEHVYMMVTVLAHGSSSGINFIIYGVTNRNFRNAYIKALRIILPKRALDKTAPPPSTTQTQQQTI